MKERILLLEDIGYVRLKKRKRSRRIGIILKPFKGISVTVPYHVSYKEAERFVREKTDWIKSHLPSINAIENSATVFDEQTVFQTRNHTLTVLQSSSDKISIRVFPGTIEIVYPDSSDICSDEIQSAIRKGIEEAWRIEAKQYLPDRVETLAVEHGFQYQRLFIKNIRTRWGSCSYQNNINLSLHLMRLPDRLIDYIILHELVHTIIKNHSTDFWQKLETVCQGAKQVDKELNQWRLSIY